MANEYFKRTPTSTGNRTTWTLSCWAKISGVTGADLAFFGAYRTGTSQGDDIFFRTGPGGAVRFTTYNGTSYEADILDNAYKRDNASWMHVMAVANTTAGTTIDRWYLYVNGVRITDTSNNTYPSINLLTNINNVVQHYIGAPTGGDLGQVFDIFFVDGQALTPDVFGFYKEGKGYQSSGTTQATDFRPGQWVPKAPRTIKTEINRKGGFGVNGFYLPMNDSSNLGADFHTTPNSIITLKGEDLPQPQNGAPTTTDAYVSQLRSDPYAANLVLAVPGIGTAIGADIVSNGYEWTGASGTTPPTGWYTTGSTATYSVNSDGQLVYNRNGDGTGSTAKFSQDLTTVNGKVYHLVLDLVARTTGGFVLDVGGTVNVFSTTTDTGIKRYTFTATSTTTTISMRNSSTSGTLTIDNVKVRQVDDAPRDYSADIKGSGTNKTLTANGNAGVGYEIPSYYGTSVNYQNANSYVDTPGTSGDFNMGTGDFTVEGWFYPIANGGNARLFGQNTNNYNAWDVYIDGSSSSGQLWMMGGAYQLTSASIQGNQWNHVAISRKNLVWTTYINGVAAGIVTSIVNNTVGDSTNKFRVGQIGENAYGGVGYGFQGYIQDFRVYKGVAKYKGGFDVPKPYTPVGISTWRAVPDCTANNFATWTPLLGPRNCALADGNLTVSSPDAVDRSTQSTIGVTSGKWYWEYRVGSVVTNSYIGVSHHIVPATGLVSSHYLLHGTGSNNFSNPSGSFSVTNAAFTTGMIIGCAFDYDAGTLDIYKDGTLAVEITGGSFGGLSYHAHNSFNTSVSDGWEGNFGQNPTFSGNTTAGTYTDSNGKGLFKYQPPTGFLALCEDNLPTPAIADPGDYFKTVLWTGSASTRGIVGVGFKPDLVWVKSRSNPVTGIFHTWVDSVRGAPFALFSNSTDSEDAPGGVSSPASVHGGISSFDNDGFSIMSGSSDTFLNNSGTPYVAWCWKAGGAAVSNTDGSITSQVSANQTAGFSIVSYTGTGTNATVGHGLNKTPKFIITKNRDASVNWIIYHGSVGATQYLRFTTNAATTQSSIFNDTEPTSSVFSLGSSTTPNGNGQKQIAYCWTEIEGFSKFGSYVANNSADGPFVYCGFKPALVLVKNISTSATNWELIDNVRSSTNGNNGYLIPNDSGIEYYTEAMDLLSNGFKIRTTSSGWNSASGNTYIFAAFSESPFQTANAK